MMPVDRDLVVELTRDLIRFHTVNPPGDELPAAEYLGRRMEEMGLEVELQALAPNRANLIGRLPGEGEGHLVFTGHLDVVPPGGQEWEHAPFEAEVANGRIFGRGSVDMKGAVASITAALGALARAGFRPKADVIAAITCGEEVGALGARAMVERRSLVGSRYLVVGEPSGLDVFIGEKGPLGVRIRALGRTGHGSMPQLGINAVSYMARLIPRLEAYPFPYQESALLGHPTLSVNVITGGNKLNVVPDVCEIQVDLRTLPGQNQGQIVDLIREMAWEVARTFHPDLRVEVDAISSKPPLETDRAEPLVGAMVASVEAVRGTVPFVGGVPYGTDAAVLGPGFDIPMVICGPGEPGMAHQPDEAVEVEQLAQATEIYVDLTQRLLG